ncbi:GerAB/ArcD/ProY family transporter [Neobacillus sp. SAB-20_R2A]|uniref:GerAB/ArcD/ProY family transporter n=1 Tax=Neobacillus sp. SAB-20_R2A TaxID=3120519 RepID=UPI003C6EA0ED
MIRHFYYIVILTMMINIMVNVPAVLIQKRFDGTIMSMILSVFIGGLLVIIFTFAMGKYPQKGLPEIFLLERVPAFIRNPYLAFLALMWIAAGSFALISYSYVIKLYISPDMSLGVILAFLLIIVIFGALKKTDSILFLVEIVVLPAAPLVAFILFKAFSSKYFYWEHIFRMLHNIWQFPSYSSIAAATYVFIGYINLVIMNRFINSKKVLKFIWILPIIGFLVIICTFFIPIAFLGVDGVNDVVFPWIFISDSLRMEFGFIERVLYLILCLYLLLILVFGIITWHVGLKLLEGIIEGKNMKRNGRKKIYKYVFLISIGLCTIILQSLTNQREFFYIVKTWLNIRFPAEIMLVALVFFLSRRRKT